MAKTNSGLLEFKDDQKVLIALDDATSEVKKAVIIDADGTETDIAGGGGSSDFSTAQVTVTEIPTIYGAFVSPNDEWSETNSARLPSDHGSGVHTLILYKGKAHITVEVPLGGSVTVSGNIEQYGLVSNEFIVTGDCSIAPSV